MKFFTVLAASMTVLLSSENSVFANEASSLVKHKESISPENTINSREMYKEIMNKVQDAVTCVSSNTRDSKLAHDIASNTAQDSSQQTDVLDRAHEKLLFNRKNEEEVTKEVSRIYSTIVANAEKLLHAAVEAQQVIENKLDHAQAFSKGLRDERTMMSKTAQKQRLEAIAFKESSIATAKADYQTVIELATSVKLEELTSCQETHKDRMRLLDLDASTTFSCDFTDIDL